MLRKVISTLENTAQPSDSINYNQAPTPLLNPTIAKCNNCGIHKLCPYEPENGLVLFCSLGIFQTK